MPKFMISKINNAVARIQTKNCTQLRIRIYLSHFQSKHLVIGTSYWSVSGVMA